MCSFPILLFRILGRVFYYKLRLNKALLSKLAERIQGKMPCGNSFHSLCSNFKYSRHCPQSLPQSLDIIFSSPRTYMISYCLYRKLFYGRVTRLHFSGPEQRKRNSSALLKYFLLNLNKKQLPLLLHF